MTMQKLILKLFRYVSLDLIAFLSWQLVIKTVTHLDLNDSEF